MPNGLLPLRFSSAMDCVRHWLRCMLGRYLGISPSEVRLEVDSLENRGLPMARRMPQVSTFRYLIPGIWRNGCREIAGGGRLGARRIVH